MDPKYEKKQKIKKSFFKVWVWAQYDPNRFNTIQFGPIRFKQTQAQDEPIPKPNQFPNQNQVPDPDPDPNPKQSAPVTQKKTKFFSQTQPLSSPITKPTTPIIHKPNHQSPAIASIQTKTKKKHHWTKCITLTSIQIKSFI